MRFGGHPGEPFDEAAEKQPEAISSNQQQPQQPAATSSNSSNQQHSAAISAPRAAAGRASQRGRESARGARRCRRSVRASRRPPRAPAQRPWRGPRAAYRRRCAPRGRGLPEKRATAAPISDHATGRVPPAGTWRGGTGDRGEIIGGHGRAWTVKEGQRAPAGTWPAGCRAPRGDRPTAAATWRRWRRRRRGRLAGAPSSSRTAIRSNQKQSEAIRSDQKQLEVGRRACHRHHRLRSNRARRRRHSAAIGNSSREAEGAARRRSQQRRRAAWERGDPGVLDVRRMVCPPSSLPERLRRL